MTITSLNDFEAAALKERGEAATNVFVIIDQQYQWPGSTGVVHHLLTLSDAGRCARAPVTERILSARTEPVSVAPRRLVRCPLFP